MTVPDHRVRIGIWAVSDGSALWIADHVPRLVAGLVKGAASRSTMTFCICVSPCDYAAARQMLLELAAHEGADWTLTKVGWSIRHTVAVFTAWLLNRTPRLMRRVLFSMLLVLLPSRVLGALLRPMWRLFYQNGLSTVSGLFRDLRLAWQDPIAIAAAIASTLERQRLRPVQRLGKTLRSWAAVLRANEDSAARPPLPPPATVRHRVRRANTRRLPETDGWLLLDPGQVTGLHLPGRRAALLLSATPIDFPFSLDAAEWHPGGRWDRWKRVAGETLETVDAVITASFDLVDRQVAGSANISPAKLTMIPAAVPDLWPLLPCRPADRIPTSESRHAAGCVLRKLAHERNWLSLIDFPFEDVPYIFVVAQDCLAQNAVLVAEAVLLLLRHDYFNIKLFTTAHLELGQSGGPLSRMVSEAELQFDVLSVPSLPPDAYAAFNHCAAMTVYPAYVEDGLAATRFAESVSLGTPCLMAASPHSLKLFGHESGLLPFLFNPYDPDALARLIRDTAMDRLSVLAEQSAILARLPRRNWGDVADRYATIVSGRPIGVAMQVGT